MISYTGGQSGSDKARTTYRLVTLTKHGEAVSEFFFDNWRDLAWAFVSRGCKADASAFRALSREGVVEAYTSTGTPINLVRLAECRFRFETGFWTPRAVPGYVRRSTPVPGTSKLRGGRGYFRRIGTHNEISTNAAVICFEDGGRGMVRAARRGRNLPDAWDDIHRDLVTGWKAQHRGHKSWDRTRKHGGSLT